jgi:hypothetical protein
MGLSKEKNHVTSLPSACASPYFWKLRFCTECVKDLDYQSQMIIFESILSTFELSIIFRGSLGSGVNWLKLETKPP